MRARQETLFRARSDANEDEMAARRETGDADVRDGSARMGWQLAAAHAQGGEAADADLIARRNATEKELESIAIIERKVMVPMRDGKRMQADIYRPKDESKKYPIIFVRTPYNFNYWDVELGAPRDMTGELDAVKRGYAVGGDERARAVFFRGRLRHPGSAAHRFRRRARLARRAAVVERQGRADRLLLHRGVAAGGGGARQQSAGAFIPQGFGAGVGRVGPYYEQGNWFRGGAVQMLFMIGCMTPDFRIDARPMFPEGTSQQDLVSAAKSFDLDPHPPNVDWSKAFWHLPEKDILAAVGAGRGIYADVTPGTTHGNMIARTPNDPAWYKGGLWNDSMPINVPGLWMMSWYDMSVGPNLAAYNFVRKTARAGDCQ